jgi:hypothetical protein
MTKQFELSLQGTKFSVPKPALFNLFEHHPELISSTSYNVQSPVPLEVFQLFVKALATGTKVPVTKENAGTISLVAKEFYFDDLLSECLAVAPFDFSALSDRISKLENSPIIAELRESVAGLSERFSTLEHLVALNCYTIIPSMRSTVENNDHQIESLISSIETIRIELDTVRQSLNSELEKLSTDFELQSATLTARISVLQPEFEREIFNSLSPITSRLSICESHLDGLKSPIEVQCPLKGDGWFSKGDPFDGMISYLTRKHGGNVHEKKIVTITSSSTFSEDPKFSVQNVADFNSDLGFCSRSEQNQWVRWDFRTMRIRPTNYTIRGGTLKSWIIEGSVDNVMWVEIDQQVENGDLKGVGIASFTVARSIECRFVRLRQTGRNHTGNDQLAFRDLEIFGTLLE